MALSTVVFDALGSLYGTQARVVTLPALRVCVVWRLHHSQMSAKAASID